MDKGKLFSKRSAQIQVAIIIGAATPAGRLAQAIRISAAYTRSIGCLAHVIDLGKVRPEYCDGRPIREYGKATQKAIGRVRRAACVIIASPVYRASYTGILKNFLDVLPLEALQGKPVGIVAMGGSNHHYLGVDWQLRCTLSWFGAVVAPTSVYLTPQDFSSGKLKSTQALTGLRELIDSLRVISGRLHDVEIQPRPLAASIW